MSVCLSRARTLAADASASASFRFEEFKADTAPISDTLRSILGVLSDACPLFTKIFRKR
jgi:hypothetical protein